MILLPILLSSTVTEETTGMLSILSLLILDPLWAMITGLTAGGHPSRLWLMPLVMDLLFTAGLSLLMNIDSQILFYLILYTGLAYAAMIIRIFHNKRKKRRNRKTDINIG